MTEKLNPCPVHSHEKLCAFEGKWDIGSGGVFYEDCGDISVWDNEANARLIAEAPVYDLLNKAFHLLVLGKNAANDAICREIDECLSRVDIDECLSRVDGVPVQSEKGG